MTGHNLLIEWRGIFQRLRILFHYCPIKIIYATDSQIKFQSLFEFTIHIV